MSVLTTKRTGVSFLLVVGLLLGLSFLFSSVLAGDVQDPIISENGLARTTSAAPSPQDVISPTSNCVLYGRPNGFDSTIWVLTGVTDTKIITGHRPRLSHDGRYIIYQQGDADNIKGSDVYVHDLQTGTDTEVFAQSDYVLYYAWMPGDSKIVYDYMCGIYSMDPDGGNKQALIDNWPSSGSCFNDSPDVNPVDGRIAWENEYYGIGVADADGQNPAWLVAKPGTWDPRWSPDGQWIVFWDEDNAYKIRPDGTGLTRLTFLQSPNNMNWVGDWTKDGEFLVGAGTVNGIDGIYAYSASGSGFITPLLQEPGADDFFIGNAGILDIVIHKQYLPLVAR